MIEVEHLAKSYGPRSAIHDLTFQVNQGEVVGFLGPNGAGKTTTMNILCCILPASSGTARVCGFDIFEQSYEIRKRIGYLPETPPLYQDMVVSKYLAFAAGLRGVPKKQIASAVDRVLGQCHIRDVQDRIIGRLSKGYQQRIGLAQAMIHDPEILILDEPTIGLDPIQIIEIRKLIQELGKSHTILLSSHILPEVTQICQRVIIIHEGRIAAMDTLDGLNASLRHSNRLELRVRNADNGIASKLEALDQVSAVQTDGANRFFIDSISSQPVQDDVARLVLDQGWGLEELKPVSMTLEDIFLKLTTEEKLDTTS
ncbi:ABC transporter ATP-binding protein [Nitrospina gracilis]|uniref:ABC transporter ATP-binding protein n=1 Tax=Nitrospina gracilis TaxID=35801 RepID=UPI001F3F38F9|nr:ATP-binding cassette domain-containing protein [Nitrospina gracilis]MCF8721349.1 ABC-2 type transport system ATP-binding protein [Nitrospina gracilis Nb-211]